VPGVKSVGTACSTGKCNATGQCVACISASDCPDPGPCNTKACTLGVCDARPKAAGTACQSGMMCDGEGACIEKPCGNGRLDPGESCDTKLSSGCTPTCRWTNGVYVSCTPERLGMPCGSGQGWVCAPNGACSRPCASPDECKTESGYGDCLTFNGAGDNCAIKCSGTSCPINGLPCNQWGTLNICGTWTLGSDGMPRKNPP
jgi:hypothetical protein